MKFRPEDKPKVAALGISIVLVLCLFGRLVIPRLLINNTVNAPVARASAAVAARPSAASGTLPAVATGTPAGNAIAPPIGSVPILPAGVHPGATLAGKPVLPGAAPVAVAARAADPFWRPLAVAMQPPKIDAYHGKPATPSIAPSSETRPALAPISVPPIAPPLLPEMELQGTVLDETAIAVLRVGGQTRFMQEGDLLEGGWALVRIHGSAVLLRKGRREIHLTVGQWRPQEMSPVNANAVGLTGAPPAFQASARIP